MLFYSPHAALRVICSIQRQKFHPVTGDPIETTPGITAEFGKLGAAYEYTDPLTGETGQGADISGHFFDTDLEAAEKGWDQDTKEMVERKLQALCRQQPERIQFREREAVKAALPWPTYESMDAAAVVAFAKAAGLEDEALAYERENRDRPTVIDGLATVTADGTVLDAADLDDIDADAIEPVPAPVQARATAVADPPLRTISV